MDKYKLESLYDSLDQSRVHVKRGNRFWTILLRVSSAGNILADIPSGRGSVVVDETESADSVYDVPIRVESPEPGKEILPENLREAAVYVEFLTKDTVKILPVTRWPDLTDDTESPYPTPDYEDRELSEWEGTEQDTSSQNGKKATDVFGSEDRTGSKNDLIN
jgi:hypothetical protein